MANSPTSVPLNTCTITTRDPSTTVPPGRVQQDVRVHPQGGLEERCDEECDTPGRGLAVSICGNPTIANPPSVTVTDEDGNTTTIEQDSLLRRSSAGCLWVKRSLGRRFKRVIGATVAQPASLNAGSTANFGDPTEITITNDGADAACYEICVDICNAFIDCPTGEPIQIESFTGTTEDQDVTFTPDVTYEPEVAGQLPTVDIAPVSFTVDTDDQFFSLNTSGDNATFTVQGANQTIGIEPQATINIPPPAVSPSIDVEQTTLTIPGQNITIDGSDAEIASQGKAGVAMRVTFNGRTCELFAADNGYGAYSGRVCLGDVTLEPQETFTSELEVDLLGKGNAADPFTASTGQLCVVMNEVSCEVNC